MLYDDDECCRTVPLVTNHPIAGGKVQVEEKRPLMKNFYLIVMLLIYKVGKSVLAFKPISDRKSSHLIRRHLDRIASGSRVCRKFHDIVAKVQPWYVVVSANVLCARTECSIPSCCAVSPSFDCICVRSRPNNKARFHSVQDPLLIPYWIIDCEVCSVMSLGIRRVHKHR